MKGISRRRQAPLRAAPLSAWWRSLHWVLLAAPSPPSRGRLAPHPSGRRAVLHAFLGQLTVFREVSIWRPPVGDDASIFSAAEARAARVINSLQAMPPVMCHENELLYVLVFHPEGHLEPLYRFQGWGCAGSADHPGRYRPASLEDRSCSLLKVVGSLAPASAIGTRDVVGLCTRNR